MLGDNFCSFWPHVNFNYGQHYLIFFHVFSMLLAILGNFVVFFVILRSKKLWSQMSFRCIVSISMADFFVGLVGQPLILTVIWNPAIPYMDCITYGTLWTLCSASGFGVLCTTVERYLFIQYPLRYNVIFTERRTVYIILIQWLLSILFGNGQLIYRNDIFGSSLFLSTLAIMNLIMLFLYAKVYNSANKHKRKISNVISLSKSENTIKTVKSSKFLFAIIVVFCGSWYPVLVVLFLRPLYGNKNIVLDVCLYWALSLGCFNSSFNIFIYGLGNKLLRKEVTLFINHATFKRP